MLLHCLKRTREIKRRSEKEREVRRRAMQRDNAPGKPGRR
jgi:hypothetical protein